ncbi:tRNA (adenosine(37)-N6)-threonylcarbamoyltransferase complex ATPase subunit type 1 TsaE [Arcobacter sp. FWKO B]|uniref:tRNA (adenosine(37)-N6)-threonylcarbamoyltransferase complex ATPase subunit type 1 TsaE n=1 Tax=Arcobacter sp. FWKO B TaxID=2593672 RepID=UPI0018A5C2E9|nr:tRNA (adenosine(37)-N6)-threonylcarbamoyltransferase complex ATPase subunit type 1 TsaE [Arcobacter sp. FWKO B]QOG13170.1 tRNA (adenosine(37)-N6)-threonylcarbamoyltransferase complex ATPase subunit type 1 TsaE [Arcobacter sp. FWKO B]
MKLRASLDEISKIASQIKEEIEGKNIVVLLRGDLAAGKTTFVKEFIKLIDPSCNVSSPTFSIQICYGHNLYHYDLYNKTLNEFISLGLLEEFEKDGIHFVEWGDELLEDLLHSYGFETMVINIKKLDNAREYEWIYIN